MRAVLGLAGHGLRVRWRGWALFVLLVAVAGGAVLAATAGARRTGSAYPRFLVASRASDLLVSPGGTGIGGYYAALGRLPGVAAVTPVVGLDMGPVGPSGRPNAAVTEARLGGGTGGLLEIPKVLAGRLPQPDRPGEIAVDQVGAAALHVHAGSLLPVMAVPNPGPPGQGAPRPRRMTERVVGIVVTRSSVQPVTDLDKTPVILATSALWRRLGSGYLAFDGAYVKLRPSVSVGDFTRRAQTLARRFPRTGGQVYVADEASQVAAVERALRPESAALALFALVLAVASVLILGQAAVRLVAAGAPAMPTLAALGMTRAQLAAAGLIQVGVAAVAGAAAGGAIAVAASPVMPIGAARLAEPAPGLSVDGLVLAAGTAAIAVLLLARAAWPVWRVTAGGGAGPAGSPGIRAAAAGPLARRPLVPAALVAAGMPMTMIVGARLALDRGRARLSVPARSTLAGTALSVLAVTGVFTFGANLLHLQQAPRLYGKTWDVAIDLQFQGITPPQLRHLLGTDRGVTGWSFGQHGILGINGRVVPAIGVARGRGPLLSPTLLQGHPPRNDHQIVLGTATLRQAGLRVGQWVTVSAAGRLLRDQIVGRAVFPNFGQGGFTPTDLGQGAETTAAVLAPQARSDGGEQGFEFALLRFEPGPQHAAYLAAFQRSIAGFCAGVYQSTCLVTSQLPNGASAYASIGRVPAVLALVLAVLGVAVLGQAVVVAVRRQRRDFAILKGLGLLRRQVAAITSWQVTMLAGLALLAGVPLGVAAGRWAWGVFADSLGIPPHPLTPLTLVLLAAPAAVAIANVAAYWPGRAAARLRPAQVLRAE